MKNFLKCYTQLLLLSLGIGTIFFPTTANALTFNWQFTNENGNTGSPTDIIAGEVEFDDSQAVPNATNVPAIRFEITSVTGLTSISAPFFGDEGIELNEDLVGAAFQNSFSFNASGGVDVTNARFRFSELDQGSVQERLALTNNMGQSFLEEFGGSSLEFRDSDSSTLSFTQQAATPVPFEISPNLGLLILGGIFVSSRCIKHHKTVIK